VPELLHHVHLFGVLAAFFKGEFLFGDFYLPQPFLPALPVEAKFWCAGGVLAPPPGTGCTAPAVGVTANNDVVDVQLENRVLNYRRGSQEGLGLFRIVRDKVTYIPHDEQFAGDGLGDHVGYNTRIGTPDKEGVRVLMMCQCLEKFLARDELVRFKIPNALKQMGVIDGFRERFYQFLKMMTCSLLFK
jgi:hypothetical protein